MGRIPVQQWILWLLSTAVAAATLSSFAYSTFETRDGAKEKKEQIEKRLDRIENKIDLIIDRK